VTTQRPPRLVCAGCGTVVPPEEPYPFRCPLALGRDDIDHVVTRELDPAGLAFPTGDHPHPFIRYRAMLASYQMARAGGVTDRVFIDWVGELDRRIAAVAGHGFRTTPFEPHAALSARLGLGADDALWIKDETGQVAGSHKARHLMGIALHLEVAERLGKTTREETARRGLAIASCGNAALAAATLARATGRRLAVFIPTDADARVVARLEELGADITVCARSEGVAGDPCYLAFHRAMAAQALPFCCQGSDNGLTIEGGSTLAYEMVSGLTRESRSLDRLFVQVGGGALASACVQGLREARALGAIAGMPRIHAVQTQGAWPLRRAYERVRARILNRMGRSAPSGHTSPLEDESLAEWIRTRADRFEVTDELRYARTHRSQFMWPWEQTPLSIAHGILDDETYDGFAILDGMIASGGYPVTVSEERLAEANTLARAVAHSRADATGTAGLAGLLELRAHDLPPAGTSVAVLFTGGAHESARL